MATLAYEVKVTLSDGRTDSLGRNTIKASPAEEVFTTVGAILALVRVSTLILRPSVNPR